MLGGWKGIRGEILIGICLRFLIKIRLYNDMNNSFDANRSIGGMCKEYFFAVLSMLLSEYLSECVCELNAGFISIKMAIYCPQGSGTLRQQLLKMH